MKNKVIVLIALFVFFGAGTAMAQNAKIGYANPEYILSQLPQVKQLETELKELEGQLKKELDNKYLEYEQKLDTYRRGQATMPEMIKQEKEKELMNLQTDIAEFEEKAQLAMQQKHAELMKPLMDTVRAAIKKVAEKKGYTYVLSSHDFGGSSVILYSKNEEDNISDEVLKELGITPSNGQATTGEK